MPARREALTRRQLLARGASAAALAALPACARAAGREREVAGGEWVDDVHSQLNRTRVLRIERPASLDALQDVVQRAGHEGRALSICGGRHATGGQQFGDGTVLIDLSKLHGVAALDTQRGLVEVGAGTWWPELIAELHRRQNGGDDAAAGGAGSGTWSIVQKQTGTDRLSLGGSLSANAHGRGLVYRPIVQDVEAFTLVDARGEAHRCSRTENPELFALAIGGYGLLGVIASVELRLAPRRKLRRVVQEADTSGLSDLFAAAIARGALFGDFQYSTDVGSERFLRTGILSTYEPVAEATPLSDGPRELPTEAWLHLIELGHEDQGQAFGLYVQHCLSCDGRVDWSDTHQLATYLDDYHRTLGARLEGLQDGTEMICELYVPREALAGFLEAARTDLLAHHGQLVYGTIRLVEAEDETVLAWARRPWACVIFNLHTAHDEVALRATAEHFRRLVDRAREHEGSYYLTYNRWATREQVLACHPRMPEFLALKRRYDPDERFQSDWYRHCRALFAGA